MKYLWMILLALIHQVANGAAPTCTYYTISGVSQSLVPENVSREALKSAFDALGAPTTYGSCELTLSGGTYGNGSFKYKQGPSGTCPGVGYGTKHFVTERVGACPADDCQSAKTINEGLGGVLTYGAYTLPSGQMCLSDDGQGNPANFTGGLYGKGCAVQKAGSGIEGPSGHWFGQLTYTGQSCGETSEEMPQDTDANCVTTSSGQICISKEKSGCGTVNGERVCLQDVPPGKCLLVSGGGAICEASADSPPAPDDGEGNPVDADMTMEYSPPGSTTTNTYRYYGPTVVAGSQNPVTGAAPGSADGNPSTKPDDGSVDGPEEYGSAPSEWEECGEDIDACIQGQLVGKVQSLRDGVPLLAFVSDLDAAFSSDPECPSVMLTVLGAEHDVMAPVCSVLEGNRTLFALVFQIGWAFCGLRVLLKAQQ